MGEYLHTYMTLYYETPDCSVGYNYVYASQYHWHACTKHSGTPYHYPWLRRLLLLWPENYIIHLRKTSAYYMRLRLDRPRLRHYFYLPSVY